jgi:hypothetical protein
MVPGRQAVRARRARARICEAEASGHTASTGHVRLEIPTACVKTMPLYPVTVTASYIAARAPDDTVERLRAWAAASDGRTFTVDDSIAPVRWTATVDYQIDADSQLAAERLAVERYAGDADEAGITRAETVIAATGPLT